MCPQSPLITLWELYLDAAWYASVDLKPWVLRTLFRKIFLFQNTCSPLSQSLAEWGPHRRTPRPWPGHSVSQHFPTVPKPIYQLPLPVPSISCLLVLHCSSPFPWFSPVAFLKYSGGPRGFMNAAERHPTSPEWVKTHRCKTWSNSRGMFLQSSHWRWPCS